jgi:hypothetical protein
MSGDVKVYHALPVKLDMRQPFASEREHRTGAVESRDFIIIGKKSQNGARAAPDLKDGLRVRFVIGNEGAGKVRRL